MIDVHLLRYALAAAETGSFSAAADRFQIKQSTLSKRICDLELRLGLALFARSTRGVAPTAVGLRFLARARTIVAELEALSAETSALASGSAGRLRIGFQGSLASGDLRAVLDAYRLACPDVELEGREDSRDALLVQLDRDTLDLAIVAGEVGDTRHRSLCLWSEPLLIGLARGHRLEQCSPIYWTDLRGVAFMVTRDDPGPLLAKMIHARLSGPACTPTIVTQSVGRENLLHLAGADHVTVTAGGLVTIEPDIILRHVHDAFGPTRVDQGLHWRADNPNPALKRFLALVAKRYGRPVCEVTQAQESGRPPRWEERDGLPPRRGGPGGGNLPARI